jgi:hypothetical protein
MEQELIVFTKYMYMRCFSLFRDTWRNIATSLILNICWKKSTEPNRISLRSVFITISFPEPAILGKEREAL